ncbi:QueT transporter family protein [Lacticaseibacillus sp. N501-2]|uniref:QueT transporter family protein n=1 Tax=Lacticaseibacillus salsurae TaxID=3367729 RepID=UPI0038B32F38
MQQTTTTRSSLLHLTQIAIIASLYVVLTVVFSPLSYGVVQIRFSEMLNYTALFKKRYVWAVTLGVLIANFFSPTWLIDVPVGTIGTLIFLLLGRWLANKTEKRWLKFLILGVIFTASMFTVAGQLAIVNHIPFWPSYASIALGEALSMGVGAVIMRAVLVVLPLDR